MVPDSDHFNKRMDSLEHSMSVISDSIGRVAEFMERLVVLEERNNSMTSQFERARLDAKEDMRELKETQKELTAEHKALADKVDKLNNRVTVLTTGVAVVLAIISIVEPILIKVLF